MLVRDISKIFKPEAVALFGASERRDSTGAVILQNLLEAGFQGPVYPINPKYQEVQGIKAYPSIREVGEPADVAVIATPALTVPQIIRDCGESGVPTAIIISAGFRDAGEQGRRLEEEVLSIARSHGIRFLGPNCLGVLRPDIGFNGSFSHGSALPGRLGLVSQSGALCTGILDWAQSTGVGFSSVISTGVSADVDFGEILDFLVEDELTDGIMLYIEGIHDARRFMSALRSAARAKPVIVMKAGRHSEGSQAAASHTGALVGSDDVFDAALRRAGVVRVSSFSNFFAAASTLHAGVRTRGNRLAIVTNGGGPAVMAADSLADKRLPLARLSDETIRQLDEVLPGPWSHSNPVDVLGDAGPERYEAALQTCLKDDGVDAVIAILTPQAMTHPEKVAKRVVPIAGKSSKPVFTCWMGESAIASSRKLFRKNRIPTYRTPEAAVESFATVVAHHDNQQLLLQVPEPGVSGAPPDIEGAGMIIEGALADRRSILTLAESKALLAAFHIPILKSLPAREPSEALLIAEEIGFPVALKIHSPDITHKSDVGGVRLNISSARELGVAFRNIVDTARAKKPDARIDGVIVEPMWSRASGRELLVGVASDPVFGPAITFGLGGTLVEVIRDRATALPPLNRYLARKLIAQTRASRYLEEFRGKPAVNRRALEDVLLRVSEMVCEVPWIKEMDINPLIADEEGVVAVDARVIIERRSAAERDYAHMSIHPYPSRLVTRLNLADGTAVTLRPIRPEDSIIEREFVNGLSDEAKYFRFMYALKEITPEMLSRFTQIDYDREMALIAVIGEPASEQQIGVARYVTYRDGQTCEFAVVVADAWQGKGIATQLLKGLIDIARERRLQRMEGVVLAQNRQMLRFSESIGFKILPDRQDPQMMRLALDL